MGNILNDVLGVTSANKQQAGYNMKLQKDAQAYSTWQMQNAHQMETQDLINAGINPVLSANGGASAGVSAGSTGAGGGGAGDPISMIATLINTANNSAKTDADIKNSTARTQAEINKLLKDAGYTQKQIEYYNKHGVFPGATTTTKMNGGIGWGLANGGLEISEPVGLKGGKIDPKSQTSAKKHNRIVKDMSAYL